jgi:pimeloyl-ACP methyl ester carboxylesterase
MPGGTQVSVAVSEELYAPVSPGVELCYQTFGDPGDEPLLLVMGLGGPMTWWDPELCTMLAQAGFFVVRYDNRDTGRSTKLTGRVTRKALVKAFLGKGGRPAYTLDDMAGDAFGLMSHLGWDSAHVCGVSMGGMIAQTMAINEPARVRSLVSIMSTLGKRSVGWQHPSLIPALIAKRGVGREAYVESSAKTWKMIGSPGYPIDDDEVRARAAETYDRGVSASGVMRQMMAVLTQPNRSRGLASLRVPTAVVHGSADKMVHVSGGRATARAIPGSELVIIDGMGHDTPRQLFGTFTEIIRRTADRAPVEREDRSA